jgi:hypothetical protein
VEESRGTSTIRRCDPSSSTARRPDDEVLVVARAGAQTIPLGIEDSTPGQAPSQSGNPAAKVDVERVGPQVGTGLPDFSLRDQHGDVHSLKSLLGPKGALIVFFRSADW